MDNDLRMLQLIQKRACRSAYSTHTLGKRSPDPDLRKVLAQQALEYRSIEEEASALLDRRGRRRKGGIQAQKYLAGAQAVLHLGRQGDPSANIARVLLRHHGEELTQSIHELQTFAALDPKVSSLSKRLLQTEQENMTRMKEFL